MAVQDLTPAFHIAYSEIDTDGQFTIQAGGTTTFGAVDIDAAATTNEAAGSAYIVQSSTQHSEHSERDADWGFQVRAGDGQSTQSGRGARIRGEITDNAGTIQVQVATPAGESQLEPDALRALAIEQASEPQSAWLIDLAQREDIDWQGIANVEDQWDYEHSGLTQAGTVAVVVVASVVTGGAASSAGAGTATSAGAASVGATSAVVLANSGGDLGAVIEAWGEKETWQQAAVASATAGILSAPIIEGTTSINQWAGLTTTTNVGATVSGSGATLGQQIGGTLARAGLSAGINKAVYGGDTDSIGELFRDALVGDLAAIGANDIGTQWGSNQNPAMQTIAHAGLGCAAAVATEGDCAAGAAGGAAESVLGNAISAIGISVDRDNDWARGAYTAGAALVGGGLANELGLDVEDAQGAAQNAAVNNFLLHSQQRELAEETSLCAQNENCDQDEIDTHYQELSDQNNEVLAYANSECLQSNNCDALEGLIDAGMPTGQGYRAPLGERDPLDAGAFDAINSDSASHNNGAVSELLNRPLADEIRYVPGVALPANELGQDMSTEGRFIAAIDAEHNDLVVNTGGTAFSLTIVGGEIDSLNMLLTGKDLAGDDVSRWWGVVGVVTGGLGAKARFLGKVDGGAGGAAEQFERLPTDIDTFDVSTLGRGIENLATAGSVNDARTAARKFANLPEGAVDFVQEIGPLQGTVTGRMSPDSLRGWRLDYDDAKGFHVNWWDRSAGPKRSMWKYGAIKVEDGTLDDMYSLMQHFPKP